MALKKKHGGIGNAIKFSLGFRLITVWLFWQTKQKRPNSTIMMMMMKMIIIIIFSFFLISEWSTSGRATCVLLRPLACVDLICGHFSSRPCAATAKSWWGVMLQIPPGFSIHSNCFRCWPPERCFTGQNISEIVSNCIKMHTQTHLNPLPSCCEASHVFCSVNNLWNNKLHVLIRHYFLDD